MLSPAPLIVFKIYSSKYWLSILPYASFSVSNFLTHTGTHSNYLRTITRFQQIKTIYGTRNANWLNNIFIFSPTNWNMLIADLFQWSFVCFAKSHDVEISELQSVCASSSKLGANLSYVNKPKWMNSFTSISFGY